jgi:uncharacterized protein (TIGR03067 family)
MKLTAISTMFAALLVSSASAADEKDLNGAWTASEATRNGAKVSDDLVKSATVVFADGKYTASLGDITETGTFKIDRAKKPNTIDMKPSDGAKKGTTTPGIFELDGDTLKLCFALETNRQPSDFTSTADNKHFVVVYKRKK